tara:strand:- start:345 stop:1010 length:666 start_codon:yes stop_codon:yes gene_type:complete
MSEYSRFSVAEDFSFLSPVLNNLPSDIKSQLVEVVYCWRDGVESVSVVTESLDCLSALLNGNVPTEISEAKMYSTTVHAAQPYQYLPRYGVDLDSIGTDNLRLATGDEGREGISAVAFKYDSSGNLIEREDYWRDKTGDQSGMLVDRYDAYDNLIISKELDSVVVAKDDFLGSSEIADKIEQIANEKRYGLVFANKVKAKESHIRIRRSHVMLGAHIEAMR